MKTKKLILITVLIVVASLMLMAFDLLQSPPFETIEEFLLWLAFGGGAAALVGFVLTLFVYQFAFWHKLPYWAQITIPIVVAALVGAAAQAVLELKLYTDLPPAATAIFLALVNWLTTQIAQESRVARYVAARASNRPMKKS